jgi:3-(3-hydroxy-phenyl)propionate hydroxylase
VNTPITIVGAGPVGLCSALALELFGLECIVLEDDSGLSTAAKAGTILPRSLEIFDRLGVIDGVLAAGLRVDEIALINRRTGRIPLRVRMSDLDRDTAYPFIVNLPQTELEPVLLRGLRNTDVRFNHRVVGLQQSENGCSLEVQAPDRRYTLSADAVLGCDGGRSTVRELSGVQMNGRTLPERIVVIDVAVDRERDLVKPLLHLSYIFDPEEWIIRIRLPHFWRVTYPLPPDAPEPDITEAERKVRLGLGTDRGQILNWSIYKVHHRFARSFRVGRVFLLGDAAHLITPIGGLGLNTGIGDAFNLAWKLAWTARGLATSELLETYEMERMPISRDIVGGIANRNLEYITMRDPLRRLMRAIVFAVVGRTPTLRWKMAYRSSLLELSYGADYEPARGFRERFGSTRRSIAVGDRAPDGLLVGPDGHRIRLHDLLGHGFVVLTLFAEPAAGAVFDSSVKHLFLTKRDEPVNSPARQHTYFDPGGRVGARFGGKPGVSYVIRPDQHVSGICREPDEIPQALARALRKL